MITITKHRDESGPAIGRCHCGRELELSHFTNTCECGADYNSSGQHLAPREQWGEETGETAAEILLADSDHDGYPPRCSNPGGHVWVCSGTAYGGDDESYMGEGRSYCEFCGADGDA